MKDSPDSKSTIRDDNKFTDDIDIKASFSKDESKELLFYFSQIPFADRKTILDNMAQQSAEKYNLRDEENKDAMDSLLKAFMADKTQRDGKFEFPSSPTPLAPPLKFSKSGLEINLTSRSIDNLKSMEVILSKQEQGSNPIAKIKTREKVVKAIDPKLSTNNISHIITSDDAVSFDIAADALSWQARLKNIRCFCLQYDMLSILMIPQGVDYSNPLDIIHYTTYKDAINNWQDHYDEDYFKWPEFILCFGSETEIESDAWLEGTLHLSMESTLKEEVNSDISAIPLQQ
jgi:hypothetical protein